jgi:beta-glucosidase
MKSIFLLICLTVCAAVWLSSTGAQVTSPADQPVPRSDRNSQIAHEQLLAKARAGGIDAYFLGDSITRRWGATDYPEFLANWKQNFFGWNAANFGWGGDTTQNILWRLEHGELDGVNPKVIVLLAGTNNVGREPADDGKVADISRGIKAIVDLCRTKAPRARIILMAIFPRNDSMEVGPSINRINENIAKFADGQTVRFVNINDQLADKNGVLVDGVMVDKLHLSLKGYQIWADALKPIFKQLLGSPANTDHAPPPTGDPGKVAPTAARFTDVYKDTSLPIDQRVNDLVARMTLAEKVSQMMNGAAAIERLDIPAYEWWNEALHGVARAGYATVFPQAIGLAATWDTDLMHQVADVISTEARAKYHEALRHNQHGRYQGLTFWSPNINIFRDPRWGRGQETYGEDPYLTARLGVEFVRGLQGDDPKYFKVIATPKHYAVHSGPEPERHSFDAPASERDLRETYLPAFRATITEGKADSVMCAYNRTNGEPCCANKELMTDILRGEWKFGGYVVSDCGAIDDIYLRHKYVKTEAEASALAVKAGTDLTCGTEYRSLVQAVKDGLITEAEIDVAVKRLMTARFRLGMFDPPEMVKYAQIPFSENDSAAHRELALKAARESIVLLKNEEQVLPLKKDIRKLAVIGPNADVLEVLLGNYNGTPSKYVTPLQGIRNKVSPATEVLYAPGGYKIGALTVPVASTALSNSDWVSTNGLRGEYFDNRELKGRPTLLRSDAEINFDWGAFSPAPALTPQNYSVRWSGKLTAPTSGKYLLGVAGNGGMRLYLDGQLLVEDLANRRTRTITKEINLEKGRSYDLKVEYIAAQNTFAAARLIWAPPDAEAKLREEAINKARQADAVVVCLGLAPQVEGEEMDVKLEGFRGGDRTDIGLPKQQEALLQEIQALGKPVVLVLLNGSAVAVNWAHDHVPAILDAWYPGEEGGTAIADVLFGDYNPAGRLPVTFYKSVDQLPPFTDYRMEGRTYRYFKGEPLYPFGFGLSFTRFKYDKLKLSAGRIKPGGELTVSTEVQNIGDRAGEEVVQLYLSHLSASVPVPIRSLAGLKRVHLEPREKRMITFKLSAAQMSIIDDNGKRVVEPAQFLLTVGGSQPGFTSNGIVTGRFQTTGKRIVIE